MLFAQFADMVMCVCACVCELPDSKVLCTIPDDFGMALNHMMSLLAGVPLHSYPKADLSQDPSGILQTWFDCLYHTLQSTKEHHTHISFYLVPF